MFLDFYSVGKVKGVQRIRQKGVKLYDTERSFQDLTNICCKKQLFFFYLENFLILFFS